jgi:hypothetical protein
MLFGEVVLGNLKFVNKRKVHCPHQKVICSSMLFGEVVLGNLNII